MSSPRPHDVSRRLVRGLAALLVPGLLLAPGAALAKDDIPYALPASSPGEPNWTVPLVHSGFLLVAGRASLAAVYRGSYLHPEQPLQNLKRSYTRPPVFYSDRPLLVSDGSPLLMNVVGHTLFGSEVYQRTRACGHGRLGSFLMATGVSAAWEYVAEAINQHPSAFDLIWTPVAGAVVGEARFQAVQWLRTRAHWSMRGRELLLFLVDPAGEFSREVLRTDC